MSRARGKPVSVDKIRSTFFRRIEEIEEVYKAEAQASSSDIKKQRAFSEYALLSAAVAWELFLNDLFIARVKNNQEKAKENMEKIFTSVLMESLSKKQRSTLDKFGGIHFSFRNLNNKEEAKEVLDMEGRNITFSKYEEIIKFAYKWLTPEDAKMFEIVDSRRAVINLVIAIRNRIAHQSTSSKEKMTSSLKERSLGSNLRRGEEGESNATKEVRQPGVYLQAKRRSSKNTSHTQARLLIILSHLKDIGNDLCPRDLSDAPQRRRGRSRRKRSRKRSAK